MNERNWWGVTGGVLILVAAMGQLAQAKDKVPIPSGNLNLRIQGYAMVGSDQVSIRAIGQEIADTQGNFNGDETFTYVDASASPTSTAACSGTVTGGTIVAQAGSFGTPGEGEFVITVPFSPTTPVTGTACVAQTTTMQCERTLAHKPLVNDLNAGAYHCIVTGISGLGIGAASMEGHLDSVAGSNSPNS
ncbi:MAG TPA: hypothetical protein VMT61_12590 [Candidatus Binataceae bacterium]|nr:hypothetical protein [Candidatus Binataceae bacterium]